MTRALATSRAWMRQGAELVEKAVDALDENSFSQPSLLPGWTRKHVVAHVAANAEAVGNLVQWAATGTETPMYASADARAAGIELGAHLSAPGLQSWLRSSSTVLEERMDRLSEAQWSVEVSTAQGRVVPASETPWMRAREVCVHAVDLNCGITFADLPEDFVGALVAEVTEARKLDDVPAGDLPDIAAWLTGRPHTLTHAPTLGPWL